MKSVVLLLLAVIQLSAAAYYGSEPLTYAPNIKTGVEQSRAQGKPIILFVHLTNCPACKRLKADLQRSREIQALAEKFTIIHSLDGSEPQLEGIGPDGRYFPRFIFLGDDLQINSKIYNVNQPKYRHFYETAKDLAKSMNEVLAARACTSTPPQY